MTSGDRPPAPAHQGEPPPPASLTPLQRALLALRKAREKIEELERAAREPIAVIGVGCRFPGCGTGPDAFFRALLDGVDGVRRASAERWPDYLAGDKAELRWAALLDGIDSFDAAFFEISPREASSLDPQQRLLLEVVWEALEHAGESAAARLGSRTGVFVGMVATDYLQLIRRAGKIDAYTLTGNMPNTAAGRLSYTFGWQGPCVTVDTACSSSLVAVHLACESLRRKESELAVAGGVGILLDPESMLLVAQTQALSPDGRCKTFDARANGFVRGEGCGVVVLKRLADAERDKDAILAILRGSAVNQDGRSTGLAAPNVLSQQAMLRQALDHAGVSAEDIGYVETHGTGTSLGDPIEIEALKAVLGKPRPDGSRCVLGALKTNIGHLEAAAGVAGLIKTILCLEHGAIPRNLHFQVLNPRMSLDGTPLVIPTATMAWERRDRPRLAGVSAFGLSGTNAHVIVEEPPPNEAEGAPVPEAASYLVPLSAKSPEALMALAGAYGDYLAKADARLHDIAYTASARRRHHEHRLVVVGTSKEELAAVLAAFARGRAAGLVTGQARVPAPRIVLVFPGQGPQWAGMGKELLDKEPVFRDALDACDAALLRHSGFSVKEELCKPAATSRLAETLVAQPALFALEVALAALLRSWGVTPDLVIGHSLGEIAAAQVAGMLELEQAAVLVAARAAIMQKATGHGKMIAASLTAAAAVEALVGFTDRADIAAINDPGQVVLSGETAAIASLREQLSARGVETRELRVNYAFHSPQMEPLKAELVRALGSLTQRPGTIPMISTVTGERTWGEVLGAAYWGDNIRRPVLLARAVAGAAGEGPTLFVEVGPHPVLALNIEKTLAALGKKGRAVPTLRRQKDERAQMLSALGHLHTIGHPLEWKQLYPSAGRVVRLPAYPWQRQRYWYSEAAAARPVPRPDRMAWRDLPPAERGAGVVRLVREQLAAVLHLSAERLDGKTQLKPLGIDSLMGLEVRDRLAQGLGLTLPATLLWQFTDIDSLAAHLLSQLPDALGEEPVRAPAAPALALTGASVSMEPAAWVQRPRSLPDARVRLFCLPYAGVGTSRFRAWPELVPPWVEVCPIQLPGREERLHEPAFDAVEPLIDALAQVLQGYLDRPFAIFGCSLGAVLAFELARALRDRRGLTPAHLFVAACAAPQRLNRMQDNLSALLSKEGAGPETIALLRSLGILAAPAVTDAEMLAAVWPTLRADVSLLTRYTCREITPLESPITAFGGVEDRGIGREDLAAWHILTSGAFQLVMMPGGHLFMDTSPKLLLEHIERGLRT